MLGLNLIHFSKRDHWDFIQTFLGHPSDNVLFPNEGSVQNCSISSVLSTGVIIVCGALQMIMAQTPVHSWHYAWSLAGKFQYAMKCFKMISRKVLWWALITKFSDQHCFQISKHYKYSDSQFWGFDALRYVLSSIEMSPWWSSMVSSWSRAPQQLLCACLVAPVSWGAYYEFVLGNCNVGNFIEMWGLLRQCLKTMEVLRA